MFDIYAELERGRKITTTEWLPEEHRRMIPTEINTLKPRLHSLYRRLRNRGFPAKDAIEDARECVATHAEANVLEKFGTRIVTSYA